MRLLDANILIYALDKGAPEHGRVASWLQSVYQTDHMVLIPIASARVFLRVATNPRVLAAAFSLEDAMTSLRSILDHPKTTCPEPGPSYWGKFEQLGVQTRSTGSRLSDVHIAALALEQGAVLCTADRDFLRFPELKVENPLD